jgi:hypothetical protein
MNEDRDLPVPKEASADPNATEVLRAWVADGGLVCNLRPSAWEDAGAWGIVLADVARHVANAVRSSGGDKQSVTLARIRELFNAELADPTDAPSGYFQ